MMTDAELDELGESIMKTGELLVPLRLIPVCAFNDLRLPGRGAGGWTAAVLRAIKNKKLQLLDGRNRLEAIERWLRKHEGDPDENISIDYFFRDAEICHLDSDAEIEEQVVDLTGC